MNIKKLFTQLFGNRVAFVRGKNNNGLGTFKKARSRWFWNSSNLGTYRRPYDHPKSVRRRGILDLRNY